MIPTVFALDECGRFLEPTDIPCTITSSWKPSTGCNQPYQIFNENNLSIMNGTWRESIPFCQFNWNTSTEGAYIYNSTIEDGQINVKVDNMILASVIGLGIAALFFVFLGYKLDNSHIFLRILFTIVGIILITLIPAVLITHDVSVIFHVLMSRLIVAFWIYVGIYLFYTMYKKFITVV